MPRAQPSAPLSVLLAGGGTGGHVFPALTLAEELQGRGSLVSFAGSAHGLEARLVKAQGIPFHAFKAKPLVGQGPWGKVKAVTTLGLSAFEARRLVRRLGAQVVVGTGGYVSAPAVVGARLARRPVLLIEPNAGSGVANRWLSRLASEVAVAYEQTASEFFCPARVTGVPVRSAFFEVPALADRASSPGPPRLLVLGGSQGALQLNRALPEAVRRTAAAVGGLEVTHQCGERHLESTRQAYGEALGNTGSSEASIWGNQVSVKVVSFLDDMAGAMAASDLIVSRAGAVTLAEICAAGRPALLVPLAAALGHQLDNGRVLEAAGAARVLMPGQVEAASLGESLAHLLGDRERLVAMGAAARALAGRGAAGAIADRVEALAGFVGREG